MVITGVRTENRRTRPASLAIVMKLRDGTYGSTADFMRRARISIPGGGRPDASSVVIGERERFLPLAAGADALHQRVVSSVFPARFRCAELLAPPGIAARLRGDEQNQRFPKRFASWCAIVAARPDPGWLGRVDDTPGAALSARSRVLGAQRSVRESEVAKTDLTASRPHRVQHRCHAVRRQPA